MQYSTAMKGFLFSDFITSVLRLLLCGMLFTASACVTIHGRNGTTWLYKKPIVIGHKYFTDTSSVSIKPFHINDYSSEAIFVSNKRIFLHLKPEDLGQLAVSKSFDYLIFYKPGCSGDHERIHHFDSLASNGRRVLVVALALDTKRNQKMLAHTVFENYPVVFMEGKDLPKDAALRLISFIRKACYECYVAFQDDLIDTYCLSLKHGTIEVKMFADRLSL